MANRYRQLIRKRDVHRVIAMVFMVLLFVEWGSHGLAFSHAYSRDGQALAVGSDEPGHEDPCKTMVHGTDGTRRERPVATFGHDLNQTNTYFDLAAKTQSYVLGIDPRLSHARISGLFRPGSPPFHPPEIS